MGRLIAIGDVHACHKELEELLGLLELRSSDTVVFLGDLVNNGPDSHRTLEIARQIRAKSLLGNHELRLLNHRLKGDSSGLKKGDRKTIKQLTREDWDWMASMGLFHHAPEHGTVFVHGGFLPGIPWETQPASVVTRIQVVDKAGHARKRSESPSSSHWSTLWKGPPFVVYGHTPHFRTVRKKWSLGIDTACYQGGSLTAYILPDDSIVQVKARRKYA